MRPVDYDERLYAVYAQGRALSPDNLRRWLAAFESWAPPPRPLQVLDLGCGVGRFTPGLADTFGGPVFGVEPSERMRAQAVQNAAHPAVSYLAGSAEAIPLPDRSCDLALLYFVLHHVADKKAAAAELARVLRRGGRLFVRTNFSDRMPELEWYRFCPRAREVDRSMYEPLSVVEDRFNAAGLLGIGLEELEFEEARDRRDLLGKLRLRALSTFEHLSDDEAEQGFAAMEADIAVHGNRGPLMAKATVLVLER